VVATGISFIPQNIPQLIAIFVFKISTIFANFVTGVANTLEKFRFCTLPIHKEYFLLSIALIIVILIIAFLVFKRPQNKIKKVIVVSLCALIFISSIILPCSRLLPATVYVTNVENGINVTLRQGLKYAHFNCGSSYNDAYFNYLPSAKCETLDFLYIGKSDKITNKLSKDLFCYTPQTSVITEFAKDNLNESHIELPQNTIIANSHSHMFNAETTVQVVDTYPAPCVIIKASEKVVLISYGDNSNLNSLFETYGKPDILILSGDLPKSLPEDIETLIISSDSDIILNNKLPTLKNQTKRLYTTAENGDIKIRVK